MARITVIGGGIAGLTASIACAEAGTEVVLYEAHQRPGGRGRATAPPYVAHDGPHVFYCDGPHWAWLASRDLLGPVAEPPLADQVLGVRFRHRGRLRRVPPVAAIRMITLGRRCAAPVDRSFFEWAAEIWG